MSDEAVKDIEHIPEKEQPIEVKIVNKEGVSVVKPKTEFDEAENNEYEDMYPTREQIKEYEDENE